MLRKKNEENLIVGRELLNPMKRKKLIIILEKKRDASRYPILKEKLIRCMRGSGSGEDGSGEREKAFHQSEEEGSEMRSRRKAEGKFLCVAH